MKTRSSSPWILGTAVLVVLIMVAAWMLAVSPRMAAAQKARDDAETTAQQNAVIRVKTEALAAQAADIDTVQAELDALRVGIPAEDQLDLVIDQITRATTRAKIYIANIEAGAPEMVVAPGETEVVANPNAPVAEEPAEATPAPEATATPSPTATPAAGGAAAPVPTDGSAETPGPEWIEGFYGIPMTITAYGNDEEIEKTVAGVQEMERLFLVTGLSVIRQEPKPPSGGLPEMEDGDSELKITGYVYLLVDLDAENVEPEAGDDLPRERGSNQRNTFEGVGKTRSEAFGSGSSDDED